MHASSLNPDRYGAPVALVSLIDTDRQYFAAQTGTSERLTQARQTPHSH